MVDTTAPTVLSVSTTTADGTYRVGSPDIPITVTFSEAVTVTGSPRLQLAVGGTIYATYSSGSGTSALVFTYTIAAGNNTNDLDYSSISALQLNSGTIRDAALNDATLTLITPGAAGSISNASNIAIDTTSATVTSITTTAADGYYTVGAVIDLEVNFSEPVVVTGTPQLNLETGATDAIASYTGGSGTTALTFRYTVAAGESSGDLEVVSSSALALNGGTIRDAVGNDATLTLTLPTLSATKEIAIDTTAPTVSITTLAPAITNLSPITYTVIFSEDVTEFSSQDITVTNGTVSNFTQVNAANYTFQITPVIQGVVEVSVAEDLAKDLALNPNSASNLVTVTYDSVQPTVTLSSSAATRTNTSPIPISIEFSELTQGFSINDISVVNGVAGSLSGSGTNYTFLVAPIGEGGVEISIGAAMFQDLAGNPNPASNQLSHVYDTMQPSVTVSSSAPSQTKDAPIPFTITFSELIADFTVSDLTVTGGTVSSLSGSGLTRQVNIQPADQGVVQVSIAAGLVFDLAGNQNSASNTTSINYDSVSPSAPVIIAPAEGAILIVSQPVLSGSAEANSVVAVSAGGESICSSAANETGAWSCQPSAPLADGRYALSAVATDAAGNSSLPSTARNIVLDANRLAAPTLADGLGEITSDSTPFVYGSGPANKRISIREGQTTLCVNDTDSSGTWSCEIAPLLTGQHNLIAWATDTSDDTVSDDVSFTVLIGVAYRGVVLMTNRSGTPLEGVNVSYQTASTTTDKRGVFDLAVPDQSGVSPTLSKSGWSIALQADSPDGDGFYKYLATPALEAKSYAIWDAPANKPTHILKILNKSESNSGFKWSVYSADGAPLSSADDISLGALSDYRVDLSTVLSAGSNSYGFIEVETSGGRYDGEFESFISGSSDTQLRTATINSLSNALQGRSFVMFDTASAAADTEAEVQSAENVLLISNLDDQPRSFAVMYHTGGGVGRGTTRLDLAARATGRIELGGPKQARPVEGLIEIVPDDANALYAGILRRYGYRYRRDKNSGDLIRSNNFFIMSDVARKAAIGELVIRSDYSNTISAANYIELANTGDETAKITITHNGSRFQRVPTRARGGSTSNAPANLRKIASRWERQITIPSRNTTRVPFSSFRGTSAEGIIRFNSSEPNTVIANVVTHQYTSKGLVNASKLVPLEEVFGTEQVGFYDPRIPSALWLANVSQSQVNTNLECIVSGRAVRSLLLSIPPYESLVARLAPCFGPASVGVARLKYRDNLANQAAVVIDRVIARNPKYLSYRQRLR